MWTEAFFDYCILSVLNRRCSYLDQDERFSRFSEQRELNGIKHKGNCLVNVGRQNISLQIARLFRDVIPCPSCSDCHAHCTKFKTKSRAPYIYTVIRNLIIFFSLLHGCFADAPYQPEPTEVIQNPDPGVSTFLKNLRHDSGKSEKVETHLQERTIPGAPYYEFFINEASYKFWAVFQLTTVAILLYSAFAAIYFAKYTFLTEIETLKDEDLLLRRKRQLNSRAAQKTISATTSLPRAYRREKPSGHRHQSMNASKYNKEFLQ